MNMKTHVATAPICVAKSAGFTGAKFSQNRPRVITSLTPNAGNKAQPQAVAFD